MNVVSNFVGFSVKTRMNCQVCSGTRLLQALGVLNPRREYLSSGCMPNWSVCHRHTSRTVCPLTSDRLPRTPHSHSVRCFLSFECERPCTLPCAGHRLVMTTAETRSAIWCRNRWILGACLGAYLTNIAFLIRSKGIYVTFPPEHP